MKHPATLLVAAAGLLSFRGVWHGSSTGGIAVRLAIVAVAVLWLRYDDRRVAALVGALGLVLAAGARWGPTPLAHAVALLAAGAAAVSAVGAAWRRRRPRQDTLRRRGRQRVRRALLVVPIALFVVLPLTSETYVLATDAPTDPLPATLAGSFVQTGNVNTHYESWGTAGRPIVLVHGFLESTYVWETSAPLLARDARVFAYDVRGFGYTQRAGPFTLDGDVQQLDDFLTALQIERPVLVGHSSGAAIITAFARVHPERVAGIVLMDGDATPYGAGPTWAHDVVIEPFFTAGLRLALGTDAFVDAVLRRQCGASCDIDEDAWRAPFRQPGAEDGLLAILRRRLIGLEPAQVSEVRVPAAVISGELDSTMGPDQVAATARLLHTGLTAVLPGEHHLPMLHDPETFVTRLRDLIAALPAG